MSYIQIGTEPAAAIFEAENPELEFVRLNQIILNLPLGEDEEPIYSVELYYTIAPFQDIIAPPEYEVDLEMQIYLHSFVNKYLGSVIPS